MKRTIQVALAAAIIITGAGNAMATEEASYKVSKQDGKFEVREYGSNIIAETMIEGDLEGAGNKAFRTLFAYISGANRTQKKIEMTAPVSQESAGEEIAMTAPVSQERVENKWAVSFMMPSSYTMQTIPEPTDPAVKLREVLPRHMAAVRYSGTWKEKNYLKQKAALEEWIRKNGFTVTGAPVWARYNPPFMPSFFRRNEILIPIDAAPVAP